MALPKFERNNTIQFTFVSSVAPDAAPTFKAIDKDNTVVNSITSLQSDSTHYYALFTMPNSDTFMVGEWFAQKTVNGSARNFVRRFGFKVEQTTPLD